MMSANVTTTGELAFLTTVATVLTVFVHMSSLGLIIRTRPVIFIDMPSAQTAVFATVSRASVSASTDMKARLAKELLAQMTALAMEPVSTLKTCGTLQPGMIILPKASTPTQRPSHTAIGTAVRFAGVFATLRTVTSTARRDFVLMVRMFWTFATISLYP